MLGSELYLLCCHSYAICKLVMKNESISHEISIMNKYIQQVNNSRVKKHDCDKRLFPKKI